MCRMQQQVTSLVLGNRLVVLLFDVATSETLVERVVYRRVSVECMITVPLFVITWLSQDKARLL